MSTTLVGIDRVRVGVDTLVVAGGPLHRDFDGNRFFFGFGFDRNNLVVNCFYLFG